MYSLDECSNSTGRRYYTCDNVDDGDCHVWKWWDVAVMEELRDRGRQVLQLAEKVDNLTLLSDYETDEKLAKLEKMVCDLAMEKSKWSEYFAGAIGLLMVVMAVVVMFK